MAFTTSSWPLGLPNPSTRKQALASRSSIYRCFSDDDTGCLSGPGDLRGISKSNCQNKPKFTGFMWGSQLRRRGFIHIPGWHSAIFYSPNVSSLEFPKISSGSNYWLDLSWNQLFQYAELFMKALTEHCSLPSDCTETTIWQLLSDEIWASSVHVRRSLFIKLSSL